MSGTSEKRIEACEMRQKKGAAKRVGGEAGINEARRANGL